MIEKTASAEGYKPLATSSIRDSAIGTAYKLIRTDASASIAEKRTENDSFKATDAMAEKDARAMKSSKNSAEKRVVKSVVGGLAKAFAVSAAYVLSEPFIRLFIENAGTNPVENFIAISLFTMAAIGFTLESLANGLYKISKASEELKGKDCG